MSNPQPHYHAVNFEHSDKVFMTAEGIAEYVRAYPPQPAEQAAAERAQARGAALYGDVKSGLRWGIVKQEF